MENSFYNKWKSTCKSAAPPYFFRNVEFKDFEEIKEKVQNQESQFIDSFVDSLYCGDVYIIKKAFKPDILKDFKLRVHEYGQKYPPSADFIKTLDGCIDSHHISDGSLSMAKGYDGSPSLAEGYKEIVHNYYFHRWNDDPLGVFTMVKEQWQTVKILGGLQPDEYEKNTPLDGTVDKLMIMHYPLCTGRLDNHADPIKNQKIQTVIMMHEPGKGYKNGGQYMFSKNHEKVYTEEHIDLGDMVCFFPSLYHGVDVIKTEGEADWSSIEGRWVILLNSVDSHHVKNRVTAIPFGKKY